MALEIVKQVEDKRGKIIFCSFNGKFINIVEIKKGYARGGHFHPYEQEHFILFGKVEYRQEDIFSKIEKIEFVEKQTTIHVPSNVAHLLIAIEDAIFIETNQEYKSTDYPKYRKIVYERLDSN